MKVVSAYETNRQQAHDEISTLREDVRQLNDSLREKENIILRFGYGAPSSANSSDHSMAMQQLNDRYRELGRVLHAHKVREVSYQKQAKSDASTIEKMQEEIAGKDSDIENLRLELDSRPTLKMWSQSKAKVAGLEAQLRDATHRAREAVDIQDLRKHMSTKALLQIDKDNHRLHLYQIDALPQEVMKEALQAACRALNVHDISLITPSIEKMTHVVSMLPRLERFASRICDSVIGIEKEGREKSSPDDTAHRVPTKRVIEDVFPILQNWKEAHCQFEHFRLLRDQIIAILSHRLQDMQKNDDIQSSMAALSVASMTDDEILAALRDLVSLESELFARREAYESAETAIGTSPDLLVNRIVLHFQHVFNVARIEGVFPKVNELYVFCSEVQTVLAEFRTVLGLSREASPKFILGVAKQRLLIEPAKS